MPDLRVRVHILPTKGQGLDKSVQVTKGPGLDKSAHVTKGPRLDKSAQAKEVRPKGHSNFIPSNPVVLNTLKNCVESF